MHKNDKVIRGYSESSKLKILLLITLMAMFNSCNKDTQEPPCCANVDVTWGFYIRNLSGEDLLDPNTKGFYDHSAINHYLITDGVKKALDSKSSLIVTPEPNAGYNDYSIAIHELGTKVADAPYPVYESFLELNPNTIDTIQVETVEKNNSQSLRKIGYNKKLIWEVDGNNSLPLTITK